MSESYDAYVREEWALFDRDPGRTRALRAAVAGMRVRRVLDVGCGAGQQLRPFVAAAFGVGVDISPETGRAGRELFLRDQPDGRVVFVRAVAEHLPFAGGSFDIVISRLALPYTHNARALAETARVLQPDGVLLLKFHHAWYYFLKLRTAVGTGDVKSALHALRVLVAGTLYHLTGTQPRNAVIGAETYQTRWMLRRELRRHHLRIAGVLGDSVPAAPSLLIRPIRPRA